MIERRQNIILRAIVDANQYSRNDGIHSDLPIATVKDVILGIDFSEFYKVGYSFIFRNMWKAPAFLYLPDGRNCIIRH